MRSAIELSYVHDVVLILEDSGLVVVDIQVIGSAEDGHDTREACGHGLAVHSIAGILGFVGSNDGQEVVLLQEIAGGIVGEKVGASSDVVVYKELGSLLLAKLFQWIGPKNVTHETMGRRFAETVNLS
jgi:hypothetical protein